MSETLLEKYGVKLNCSNPVLIGFDFGDGEVSVMGWKGNDAQNYYFDSSNPNLKSHPNIIGIKDEKSEPEVLNDLKDRVDASDQKILRCYYNFKFCPDSEEYDSYYFNNYEDSNKVRIKNKDLMKLAFAAHLNAVIGSNKSLCNAKQIIIFVGRPSGDEWEAKEHKYRDLLNEGLKEYSEKFKESHLGKCLYKTKIDLVLVSESTAALAYYVSKGKLENINKPVLVIDIGSSTTDMTYIEGGEVRKEKGYIHGGRDIDKLMLDYAKIKLEETYPELRSGEWEFVNQDRQKINLRFFKEQMYGKGIQDLNEFRYSAPIRYNNKTRISTNHSIKINKSFMDHVLNGMEVNATYYDLQKSWMSGLEDIMEKIGKQLKGKDYKLIVTGGVSNMLVVLKKIEEKLGVKAVQMQEPSLSVSKGLAYIAYAEVEKIKQRKELSSDCKELIEKEFPSLKNKLAEYSANNEYNCAYYTMLKWSNKKESSSLEDWLNDYKSNILEKHDVGNVFIQWWNDQDLSKRLNELFNKKYKAVFPPYADKFEYEVDEKEICSFLSGIKINRPKKLDILEYFNADHRFFKFVISKNALRKKNKRSFFKITLRTKEECLKKFKEPEIENHIKRSFERDYRRRCFDEEFENQLIDHIMTNIEKSIDDYLKKITLYYYMS